MKEHLYYLLHLTARFGLHYNYVKLVKQYSKKIDHYS